MAGWAFAGNFLVQGLITWEIGSLISALVLGMFAVWAVVGHSLCLPLFAAWGLARETVWREGPDLCMRHSCAGLTWWTWRYALTQVGPLQAPYRQPRALAASEGGGLVVSDDDRPLRPSETEADSGAAFRGGGVSDGVAFRCEGKHVSIGAGLDEGQAARLAEVLALRFGLRLGTGPSGV